VDVLESLAKTHAPVYEALGISVEQVLEHAAVLEIEREIGV